MQKKCNCKYYFLSKIFLLFFSFFSKKKLTLLTFCISFMKLPKIFRNFYFIVSLFFVLWLCFLDSNDLITQSIRRERLQKLKSDKLYYEQKIKEISRDYQGLFNSEEALEKFAREKYYLAKPKEDVFVIVQDTSKNQK